MKKLLTLLLVTLSATGFSQKIDKSVLDEIKKGASESHSDALIIMQDGKILHRDFYGKEEKPIYIASAGKSLASLAIGKLLDEGMLDSLDQPLHTLFPEWKQGNKKDITVRMLLNHTSGLQNNPNASIELEPAPNYKVHNVIELALAAELSDLPGKKVSYNNKAVALLGGVVEKASGQRFDHFFVDQFFKPMDIAQYEWIQDESGNPTCHGAFVIKPSDFLKFGELLLNRGMFGGKRIVSEAWIDESLKQGQDFSPIWGLLWWRLPAFEKRVIDDETWASWKKGNADPSFLEKMQPLKGKMYETKFDFYADLEKALGKEWNAVLNKELPSGTQSSKRIYSQDVKAYYASGYRGNFLVIVPEHKIVAVRCADFDGFNFHTDSFRSFIDLVADLGKP